MSFSYRLAKALAEMLGQNPMGDSLREWAANQKRQQDASEMSLKAMRRARFDSSAISLTDIGLLAYRVPEIPKMVHSAPVATDTRWLRPFAEIASPRKVNATLQIGILNAAGQVLFTETQTLLLEGRTKLWTRNWLPLEPLQGALIGRWSVVIYLNGALMGIHPFEWVNLGNEDILELMYEDGEINEALQRELRHGNFRKMSLDELLADQDD